MFTCFFTVIDVGTNGCSAPEAIRAESAAKRRLIESRAAGVSRLALSSRVVRTIRSESSAPLTLAIEHGVPLALLPRGRSEVADVDEELEPVVLGPLQPRDRSRLVGARAALPP